MKANHTQTNRLLAIAFFIVSFFAIVSPAASQQILNNGRLRFGNGTEQSINTTGNLQQPFYYNAAGNIFYKLTFSNYPLDNAYALGGDGTAEWNINGTIVNNPALSSQTIDASGFIATSGNSGYGTIVTTGNITVGTQLLEVKNTYVLGQATGYIRVTTRFRNVSSTLMQNTRFWIGTRDDWVGNSDVTRKQRGNLSTTAFVPNTTTAQRALALKITTGTEGVLFYTAQPKANVIVHPNYGDFYSRIVLTNPATSSIDITTDGSYGMYVRMNDLAVGATDEFTWYYAAGDVASFDAIINQVATVSGAVQNITYTTADLNATSSVNSTGYFLVVPRNATAPTAAQIQAGVSYGAVTAVTSGSGAMTANVQRAFNMTGLTAGTNYDVYFVSQDAANAFSTVTSVQFATLAYTTPVVTTTAASSISYTTATSGGNVTADGGQTVNAKGVCWNTSANPTIANPKTTDGSGLGSFTSSITSLLPNTTYYVRAYATNSVGTSYGAQVSFTTPALVPATGLHFSGTTGSYVSLGTAASTATNFNSSSSFTIESWVKLDAGATNAGVFNVLFANRASGSTQPGYAFFIYEGKPYFEAYGTGLLSTATIPVATWTHVAFTYSNGSAAFYVNGVAAGTASGVVINSHSSPNALLGKLTNDWAFFAGAMDETRIWNRALCLGEIQNNRNCMIATSSTGLIANYHFNQGSINYDNTGINTLIDASGNNYTGTLSNFALTGATSNWIAGTVTGTCSAFVAPTATITAGGATTFCTGGSVTLTANSGASYLWSNGATTQAINVTASGNYSVTVTTNGCSATSAATVVTVNTVPIITCPSNITVNNGTGLCGAIVTYPVATATGTPAPSVTYSIPSGSLFPVGNTTVTATATNLCGFRTCTFTVTVVDNTAPTIANNFAVTSTTNGNGTVEATSPNGAVVNYQLPTASDNCASGVNVVAVPASGSVFPIGTTTVVVTATDASGNASTANFTITVVDTQAPTIASASNIVAEATSAAGAVVTYTAPTATDVVDANPTVVAVPASGSVFPLGTTTVTATATDATGNFSNSTFTITVIDTRAPVIGTLSNINVNATSAAGAVVTYAAPTAIDAVDANPTIVAVPASGSTFPIGTTTVTVTATDATGNSSQATFNVTVTALAPVVVCPANITVNNTTGQCGANVSFAARETTAIPASTITYSQASGSFFPVGTTAITVTATNAAGSSICVFNVTVVDAEGPIVTIPSNITVNAATNSCSAVVTYTAPTATDNCTIASPGTGTFGKGGNGSGPTPNCNNGDSGGGGGGGWFGGGSGFVYSSGAGGSSYTIPAATGVVHTQGYSTGNGQVVLNFNVSPFTQTFNYTGGVQTFVVPAAVTSLNVNVIGAQGGSNGGRGGRVQATVPVTPGESLQIYVGGQGASSATGVVNGGFNGGGNSGNCGVRYCGAGGGGASDIRQGGATLNNRIVVAGGGGGSHPINSPSNAGAGGGLNGGNTSSTGNGCVATYATGGTQTAGGVPSTSTGACCTLPVTSSVVNSHPSGTSFPVGTTTVTVSGTDAVGNITTRTFTVTVLDIQAPSINCPSNIVTNATSALGAVINYTAPVGTDNCSGVTTTRIAGFASGTIFPIGVTTVTYRAVDAAGNATSCSFTVTVRGLPPVVVCPANIVVNNTVGQCGTNVSFVATETTAIPASTITYSHAPGSFFPVGTTAVTVTATNAVGVSTCTFNVIVTDNQNPVVTCPSNISVNNDEAKCGATVSITPATATDNCAVATVVGVRSDALALTADYPVGSTTITWTATDIHNNVSTCTQTVVVADTENPTITCAAAQTQTADAGDCGAIVTVASPSTTDNCAVASVTNNYTNTSNASGHYPVGTTVLTWTVTDIHGNTNTCTQTITVTDNENPVIAGTPTNIIQSNDASRCDAVVTWTLPTASDNCPGVTLTSNYHSGDVFPKGTTTVTYTATDAHENSSTSSFTVTVNDNESPVISCPASVTVNCQDATTTAALGVATATDNCDANPAITSSDVSTQNADVNSIAHYNYTITRTWKATDANGNFSTCTQTITVQDITAPIVSCPASVTVNCQDNTASSATGVATGTDICSPVAITESSVSTQSADVNNAAHYNYTITRTWTATDVTGNASSCVQTITVQDITKPVITCPASVTVNCQDNNTSASTGVATGTDNCSPVTITQSDVSTYNASLTSVNHYNYVITRTWKATDVTGNFSTCVQTITVQDVTAPVVSCPASITLNCQDNTTSSTTGVATGTDICSPVTITQSDVSTYNASLTSVNHYNYVITRTWKATDVTGNFSTCVQTITVRDITAPVVSCPTSVTLNCQDNTTSTTTGVATGTDNCSPVTITQSDASTYNASVTSVNHYNYVITRTWRATDVSGNYSECVQTITVRDITAPVVTCPASVTLNCQDNTTSTTTGVATGTDNCSPVTITQSDVSTYNASVTSVNHYNYVITRTWRATDVAGNFSECVQTITVQDVTAPVVTCPASITLNCQDNTTSSTTGVATGTDNCSPVTITQSDVSTYNASLTSIAHYNYVITRTWKATDVSGNFSTCVQTITVRDITAPVVTCPASITLNCQDNTTSSTTGVAMGTDNCSPVTITQSDVSTYNASLTSVAHYNYVITRTWKATDVTGNFSTCVQTITVKDVTAPVITSCPTIAAVCNDLAGNTKTVTLVATDNCSSPLTVSYTLSGATTKAVVTSATATESFNIGTSYINWTVKDVSGNTSTCTTTVVIRPLPVASFVTSNADAFCNKLTITASSTLLAPYSYAWTYNNAAFASTQSIQLDNANGDGNYSVYTYDNYGCRSAVPAVYSYLKQNIISNYTILANSEVEMEGYSRVQSGSVGIMKSYGEAEFEKYASMTGAGAFVKAPHIDIDNSSSVPTRIIGIANVTLPTMQYNTSSTSGLPSYTVNQNQTATLTGNYKSLTIRKGSTVTLTGSVFGSISIEEGCTVSFTSTIINMTDLRVGKGPNYGYTVVKFANNTSVRVSKKVMVEEDCTINPDGNKVTFYLGSSYSIYSGNEDSDEGKFEVKGGNTTVTANIYAPNGDIKVTGGDNCHNHTSQNVNMNGLFIADEVESEGKYVNWNSYSCSAPAVSRNIGNGPIALETKVKNKLEVKVAPNPSVTDFVLIVTSKNVEPISIKVTDAYGKVVTILTNVVPGSAMTVGRNYSSGLYFAEITQGNERKVVKLIKGN